jgi:PAS domain S-box-containing protein
MIDDELAATLLDSSPDGLMLVSSDGTIAVGNRAASDIFGHLTEQLVGMNVDALVPREHRGNHARLRAGYQDDPQSRPMGTGLHLFAEHADGSMFPVEISLSPVTLDGEVYTIATVRDISDRQEALAQVALLKDRERIARDLHDMVIQRLFAAGMSLQAIVAMIEPPAAAERVLTVIAELDDTIRELRSAIFRLGQPEQTRTFSAHIASAIAERAVSLGFKPTLTIVGDIDDLPDHVCEQLSATLVEALSNVARHANARSAEVRITRSKSEVKLAVTDDGVGMIEVPKTQGGISNMMWRAAELGGACTVAPAQPAGTRLDWHVPI